MLLEGEKVYALDSKGKTTLWPTPGVGKIAAICSDQEGHLLVADMGHDCQVKAFDRAGHCVYRVGRRGGRPIRGRFIAEAMMHVSSVAVDAEGKIWVTENWDYPRRVSVWDRSGKLVRDYLGNTGYAGTGSYLHDQDPTLGYVGPLEFKLDYRSRSWKLTRILWVPDKTKGEGFEIGTGSHVLPQRFRSDVSGQMHEYLYVHDGRDAGGQVIYMEKAHGWQPVAAVSTLARLFDLSDHSGKISQSLPAEFRDCHPMDGVFWNDLNGDGKVQREECEIIPATGKGRRKKPPFSINNGWGGRIGRDLVFYTDGIWQFRPLRFTPDGAPVYGSKGMRKLIAERGDLVPIPEKNLLLCVSWQGYPGPTRVVGIDIERNRVLWEYPNPYPGVHGSHRATMPKPGMLIGPLKVMGVAKVNDEVGYVFIMRGNLGQDFIMTAEDGMFVSSMYQDCRLPGLTLPNREEQLLGMPMEGFSQGGEAFNGWFGRHDDGKLRETCGLARQACMVLELRGLEDIHRLPTQKLVIDAGLYAKVMARYQSEQERLGAQAKVVTVRRMKRWRLDGKMEKWRGITPLEVKREGSPESARVWLAHDAKNLYARFEVQDMSPWRNQGKDIYRLFKTGDCVDIQLSPSANTGRDPVAGDCRLVIAPAAQKRAVAVLMVPKLKRGKKSPYLYTSPVGQKRFDYVGRLSTAKIHVDVSDHHYVVEVAVPKQSLGIGVNTKSLRGDVGFISSDAAGTINTARTYWANRDTNLVNDEPQEAWFQPAVWGVLNLE
ncbi:MAG: hypothetical protein D6820_16000 [Lentisphaerae bacterium]|nr:MAG: hypothetical protein D6820_16000 [Lentisphaerota bacterium]